MARRRPKEYRDTDTFLELQDGARARYIYFVYGETVAGYWWELVGPDDATICSSPHFPDKANCLKSLRAAQRHASTTQVRDDA